MYQIDNPTASQTLPAPTAAGTPGYFTDGDVTTPPTIVPAEFMNMLMEELLNVLAAAGITPSKTEFNQVATALGRLIEAKAGDYAVDTGVANAYVVALNPPIAAYENGLQVKFRAVHGNTGASKLDGGAGLVPLLRDDGTPVEEGDIQANSIVSATFDAVAGAFLINSIVPSQLGELAELNVGQFLQIDGAGNLTLKLGKFLAADGAGNLAIKLGQYLGDDGAGKLSLLLGQGFVADASGNLTLKLADSSLLLDSTGLRAQPVFNTPITYFMGQM